jgi:hypothetical protein
VKPVVDGLWFALLGPVRGWLDGAELELGSPDQRAVLAFLLLREGRPATAGEIIDAVWGEDAPRSVQGVLRTYVYRLRRLFSGMPGGDPLIQSVGGGAAGRRAGACGRERHYRGCEDCTRTGSGSGWSSCTMKPARSASPLTGPRTGRDLPLPRAGQGLRPPPGPQPAQPLACPQLARHPYPYGTGHRSWCGRGGHPSGAVPAARRLGAGVDGVGAAG